MTIANGSFETQEPTSGNPGEADDWTVSETYTGEEFAEFTIAAAAPSTSSGKETFEGEWPAGFVAGVVGPFAGYFDDIDPAFFDFAGASDPTSFEDFENLWGTGSQGVFDFEASVPAFADFGPEPDDPEGFEEDWPASSVILPDLATAGSEAASFSSSGPEAFEDNWTGQPYNPSFPASGTGGELGFAGFATSYLVVGTIETFEGEYFDFSIQSVNPTTDVLTKTTHGLQVPWVVTFYNEGGRLPDGLFAATDYVVQNTTVDTWQVAARNGGTIIDIGDVGYGTHYVKHDPRWFWTEELTI